MAVRDSAPPHAENTVWFHSGLSGLVWSVVVNAHNVVVSLMIFGGEFKEKLVVCEE